MGGGLGECILTKLLAQLKQMVLEPRRQVLTGPGASVRLNEAMMEETGDQWCMIGRKESPRWMGPPQGLEGAKIHGANPLVAVIRPDCVRGNAVVKGHIRVQYLFSNVK
jgi:hypothetical protein